MRWLAVIPLVLGLPFLFFGLLWMDLIILVGVLLLAVGAGVSILFAEDDDPQLGGGGVTCGRPMPAGGAQQ